jgi:hypothetical protein
MDRRAFLAAAGAGVATVTAGCLGSDGDVEVGRVRVGGNDGGREPVKNGSVVEVAGGTLRVTATDIYRSLVSPVRDNRVYEPDGGQFLRLQVQSDGTGTVEPRDELVLELGGTSVSSNPDIPRNVILTEDGTEVALGLPVAATESAQIRFTRGERPAWRVPASLVESFGIAPEFHLLSADIVEQNGETALDLSVENRGDRDGIFRCTVASGDEIPEPVRFTVGVGQRLTVSVTNETVARWNPDAEFDHVVRPDTREFVVAEPER